MTRPAKTALALWFLLAVVVFNVRFDWQVRMAGHAFVRSQYQRHEQGQATLSINEGFRPMVRQAGLDAATWLILIAASGSALTLAAAKTAK